MDNQGGRLFGNSQNKWAGWGSSRTSRQAQSLRNKVDPEELDLEPLTEIPNWLDYPETPAWIDSISY